MIDFDTPGSILNLQERVKAEVDAVSTSEREQRFSVRLSPSTLGEECAAQTWYAWRWAKMQEKEPGFKARYMARGTTIEADVVRLLRKAGWEVKDVEPNGRQIAVSAVHGHLYGKLDGELRHEVHTNNVWGLFENKYVNYKRFGYLTSLDKPLPVSDAKYYGQICLYMKLRNLPFCMFVVGNRNDDDIEYRFFPRNDGIADELLESAEAIALSRVRPQRIAESSTFWKCKGCTFNGPCHLGEPVAINCRSCHFCIPVEGGNFYCEHWKQGNIPKHVIATGCPQHKPIF